jgi:hypothetical protein
MEAPNLDNDKTTIAFITKVSLKNNMVQWRRNFDVTPGTEMNVVTAMALSPDNKKLAVYGSKRSDNYSNMFWLWIIFTSDGSHATESFQYTLGDAGVAEHVVSDDGIVFSSNKIFLAFLQTSPTLRMKSEGKMLLGGFDVGT